MLISFFVPIIPVPFARAGQRPKSARGKTRYTPKPQADYMKAVKDYAAIAMRSAGRTTPYPDALRLEMVAVFPHPESWSPARKDATKWKTSKPDASNLCKIAEDAMNGVVFEDDAQVCELFVRKQYGPVPGLTVIVTAL